jgi:hypothetical protein
MTNPYTPSIQESKPPKRRKRRDRNPDPADAIGGVMLAIMVFIMIVVGLLLNS